MNKREISLVSIAVYLSLLTGRFVMPYIETVLVGKEDQPVIWFHLVMALLITSFVMWAVDLLGQNRIGS